MKKYIKYILSLIMRIVGFVYPYNLKKLFSTYRNVLYTLWIRNFIGHLGEHSVIANPCSLSGDGQENISIGSYTIIQSHCILGCWKRYGELTFMPSITIGDHCNIGEYNHISACSNISIGNGLLTGRYVYIGDNAHGGLSWEEAAIRPADRQLCSKGGIVIGDNVWIGDKVSILGGVSIGNNVIIGASSVVLHDVPSNCVVGGVPAKILKSLK